MALTLDFARRLRAAFAGRNIDVSADLSNSPPSY